MTPERLFTRRWFDQIRTQLDSPDRFGALIVSLRIRGQAQRVRLLLYRSGSRVRSSWLNGCEGRSMV